VLISRRSVADFVSSLVPEPGAARRMGVLTLSQSLGTGLFLTSSAIFFTTTVGLPAQRLATALSIAGLLGFLCAMPGGRLADRFGARLPLSISYAALAALFVAYAFVGNLYQFAVVACGVAICETVGSPLRAALTHALFGRSSAVQVRAQMRGLFNLGFSAGAALAGIALAAGTRSAFVVVVIANALLQLICAFLAYRLRPAHEPKGMNGQRRSWTAVKDGRFLTATILCGVLELFQPILTVGLPLWISARVGAPHAVVAGLTVLNTALVVLFQVQASKGSETVHGSARLLGRAGVLLATACVLFAFSAGVETIGAVALLVVGMVLLTVGELSQGGGAWGLSFTLPPEGRIGEYQGVFALGRGLQQFVGPALVTSLVLGIGVAGWLVLGAVFVTAGFAAARIFGRSPLRPDAVAVNSTSQ
jgi:MFS transporter